MNKDIRHAAPSHRPVMSPSPLFHWTKQSGGGVSLPLPWGDPGRMHVVSLRQFGQPPLIAVQVPMMSSRQTAHLR
jgi:hypothetical protein